MAFVHRMISTYLQNNNSHFSKIITWLDVHQHIICLVGIVGILMALHIYSIIGNIFLFVSRCYGDCLVRKHCHANKTNKNTHSIDVFWRFLVAFRAIVNLLQTSGGDQNIVMHRLEASLGMELMEEKSKICICVCCSSNANSE